MRRPWQMFVAPQSCEQTDYLIKDSPFQRENYARVPWHHWMFVIEFARKLNRPLAEKLTQYSSVRYSLTASENVREPDPEELQTVIRQMDALIEDMLKSDPIQTESTDEMPEEFENGTFADMVKAAQAVFKGAAAAAQPFQSWVD